MTVDVGKNFLTNGVRTEGPGMYARVLGEPG